MPNKRLNRRFAEDGGEIATFDFDLKARSAAWSGDFEQLLACTGNGPQDITALAELLISQDRPALLGEVAAGHDANGRFKAECRTLASSGRRWILVKGNVVGGPVHREHRVVGLITDVTARKRAEYLLTKSEVQARLALRIGNAGLWSLHLDSGEITIDDRARGIFGLPEGAISERDLIARIHPDDRAMRQAAIDQAINSAGMGVYHVEHRLTDPEGQAQESRWIDSYGQLVVEDGMPIHLVSAVRDITARKQAFKLLAASKERLESEVVARTRRLEAVVDSAVTSILTIDPRGRIQSANRATVRLFGYSLAELLGQNVRLLMPDRYSIEHDQYIRNYVETGEKRIIGVGREVTGKRKDGTTFPLHLAVSEFFEGGHRYFTGIITDLTERDIAEKALRDSQARLAQAQKMDAIGQLTGGVAHDFNNLLTVITGNLELLDMRLTDSVARDLIYRADEAARMGARLTERLLTFSRKRNLQISTVNLNEIVLGLLELLRRTLGETVAVDANLAPKLWNTKSDASEIENAILNLAINGRDAMKGGGRILLETNNIRIAQGDEAQFGELSAGDYVKLAVSDTGTGMPEDVASRAFEPFFTTKEPGRGTGLGLSTIYGFVKQSGGDAKIFTEVGKGTTASLYLPRDASSVEGKVLETTRSPVSSSSAETVLVIEDNAQVRDLTVRRLHALGYETLVAETGRDGLALVQKAQVIDLIFSDVVMPGGMSGFDVAEWVQRNCPAIKVLLTSGFAPEIAGVETHTAENPPLLRKPYSQAQLARAIRSALGDA